MTALIPDRGWYAPGAEISIEIEPPLDTTAELEVHHLNEVVLRVPLAAETSRVSLGSLPHGGYGILLDGARTAVDVLADGFERPRYGFVARLTDELDVGDTVRFARRLHLTASQLYDWAYRHSTLVPPQRRYVDPLGQKRDLEFVNRLSRAFAAAGIDALGYSAVYAIASDEVDEWRDSVIVRSDGEPYRLGDDFLVLVDPAEPRWQAHYLEQLAAVIEKTDIRGFHLDQYGWPKFARRVDGTRVDLADSFRVLLTAIRERLPGVPFMFNNVNDFPTAVTARTGQNASYIEVWDPHSQLGDLAALATATRAVEPGRPPILSAYLPCFGQEEESRANAAAQLVMATAFSHGAAHLLLGEDGAALTGPYYPDHHRLTTSSQEAFVRWYDFAVRYGDLLFDPEASDVTETFTGGINGDLVFSGADGATFSTKADAGTVWTRVVRTRRGLVVHLIDLREQSETRWDAGKNSGRPVRDLVVDIAPLDAGARIFATQVDSPEMAPLDAMGVAHSAHADALTASQSATRFAVPEFTTWAVVWIPAEELWRVS